MDGCPIDPDATRQLLERIAFIRLTHYGQSFDSRRESPNKG